MTAYRVRLAVSLKPGLLDPQGKAVEDALPTLGWDGVHDVRVGKLVELTIEAADEAAARARVAEMAERFLSNPVIESSAVLDLSEAAEQPA
jgi:phosphoribosylformylglycinamidine synthase PurS subunit